MPNHDAIDLEECGYRVVRESGNVFALLRMAWGREETIGEFDSEAEAISVAVARINRGE